MTSTAGTGSRSGSRVESTSLAGQSRSRSFSPVPDAGYISTSEDEVSPFHVLRDSSYVDSVTCQWEDCGLVYTHLPTLVDHVHQDHVGAHKAKYTCEWSTCGRRGYIQPSRFALLSHLRAHTGERPFVCTRPECDKAFMRSDTLAKHVRNQHDFVPCLSNPAPAPLRPIKRKRSDGEQNMHVPPPPGAQQGVFSTFQLAPNLPDMADPVAAASRPWAVLDARDFERVDPVDLPPTYAPPPPEANPRQPQKQQYRPPSPVVSPMSASLRVRLTPPPDPNWEADASVETLPARLRALYVRGRAGARGTVLGRPPAMVMYLLVKAKHRYASQQRTQLVEELRVVRAELRRAEEEKERALDSLLRGVFGSRAEKLIAPVPIPPSMLVSAPIPIPVSVPSTPSSANGHERYRSRAEVP
ncbi:hypothetical protein C8R46DRAFT_960841 [Mycena filopes]|nr:hypothetical protein C8R46DRAFT_960841 [Mycena filopes]